MKRGPWLGVATIVAAALLPYYLLGDRPDTIGKASLLPPIESPPGEHSQSRHEWIERLHRHAPGQNWRQMDADFRRQAQDQRNEEINLLRLAKAKPEAYLRVRSAALAGEWMERGSTNQAGRTLATEFDIENNRLNVLTQGGNLWRADRTTLNWESASDGAMFKAPFLARLTDEERLILFSREPEGIFFSDDGGTIWSSANGLNSDQPYSIEGLAVRDPTGNDVYALRNEFDPVSLVFGVKLYASANRGSTFVDLGFVGSQGQTALFSPRHDSSAMYLLDGLTLKMIEPGTHSLVTISTIDVAAQVQPGHYVSLGGGVNNGVTFLYAFVDRRTVPPQTDVYQSLDGGQTWVTRLPAPSHMFTRSSAETSTRDPMQLFVGGLNAYRSHDGGASWTYINFHASYYDNPAINLHADIPNFDIFVDQNDIERIYISTDGGVYESVDGGLTVQNLSLDGIRNSEYYGSYTQRSPPYRIMVGSQDQGYQKAHTPTTGLNAFLQPSAGDWAYLTSADGGETLWAVYPGVVMFDFDTQTTGDSALRRWSFNTGGIQAYQFFQPLQVDPRSPNRAVIAAGEAGPSANRLITLTYNGSYIAYQVGDFNFGGGISAVQFSRDGETQYVIANLGRFFRDAGDGFQQTVTTLPWGAFFSGNCILTHPTDPETIYVSGSGYAGPAVYRSIDNGDSFSAFATGLPNTLVYNLAISADGGHLFAATNLGPYYYDQTAGRWIEISAALTPDQTYWHVDYIDALHTARFATGGRGLWDFVIDTDALFSSGFE
ncbi:MAG: hypothetical protein KDI37_14600 [Xanthomonadales bacterium]|nr:hypothetical protein [Xanthomonadales bacterium]MCB1642957.1 hypothetical protein [Xanthomonadales bacterium]